MPHVHRACIQLWQARNDELSSAAFTMTPLFWVALKPLFFIYFFLHKAKILSVGIAGEHQIIFSVSPSPPLSSLSVPLHLSASPLPALGCPLGISSEHSPPVFSSGLWKRGRGGNRWIKRVSKMKREWDTVLRQWHWQRALSNVQGNKIGSCCCRRTLICILFFVLFCSLFSLPMYVSVGVCAWWFFSFSVPARLRFISLFFCLFLTHIHSSSRDM